MGLEIGDPKHLRFRQATSPLGARTYWEITSLLSEAMGYQMSYSSPQEIFQEIEKQGIQ